MSRNLGMVFPGNSLGVGSGREAVKQWRPSRSAPGVARGRMNRMGCGACWDETCREKGDVVRGGWADVARRLPASSSIWIAHCGPGRPLSFGDKIFTLSDCLRFAPEPSESCDQYNLVAASYLLCAKDHAKQASPAPCSPGRHGPKRR